MKISNRYDKRLSECVATASVVPTTCTLALIGGIAMADISCPNSVDLISQPAVQMFPFDESDVSVSSVTINQPSLLNEELNQFVADIENDDSCSKVAFHINRESVLRAKQFVTKLRGKECDVEFDIDNDGYIVLEWYRATLLQMSITFTENGMLYVERYWSERNADNVEYGREDGILDMLRKIVYANV